MYTLYFIKKMQGHPFLWGFFSPESESVDIIFHVLYSMNGATTKQKPTVAPFTNKSKQIIHWRILKKGKIEI